MKKYALQILILLLFSNMITAQGNLAKLKYEDAEEAFQKNDYQTTLTKLDEAEAILKSSNPKTQYLRILAQDKIVSQSEVLNFEVLDKLRNNCSAYLAKNGTNTSVEDQYTIVYKISERLKSYPSTQEEYNTILAKKKAAEREKFERPKKISDSLCETYKFKFGMTVDEFIAYNPEAAAILINKKQKKRGYHGAYSYSRKSSDIKGPDFLSVENNIIRAYHYVIEIGDERTLANAFARYTDLLNKCFPELSRIATKTEYSESVMYLIGGTKYSIHISRFKTLKGVYLIFVSV